MKIFPGVLLLLLAAAILPNTAPAKSTGKSKPEPVSQVPSLVTASLMKHSLTYPQCLRRAEEIMEKLNLEIEEIGEGTIRGVGAMSVAHVNCHNLSEKVYIQIAVASKSDEAADTIMEYINNYMKTPVSGSARDPATAQ